MTMKKTLSGPLGYKLTLDKGEVYENDPGAGTPAVVTNSTGTHNATYWCAMDTGELDGARGTINLPAKVSRWLDEQEELVNEFLYA